MAFVLGLGGGVSVVVVVSRGEGGILAKNVEAANFGPVVHVDEDDGATAADADSADPSVETGLFVRDEGGVLGV